MIEEAVFENNYGGLKPFIKTIDFECNWIPLTDDISVEYYPDLVFRVSNLLWELTDKFYTKEEEFAKDIIKYNIKNNPYFLSRSYIDFYVGDKLNINLVKHLESEKYSREESIELKIPEKYSGVIDPFDFIFILHNTLSENECIKDEIIGENTIIVALLENINGEYDLVLDSLKKSHLDKLKDTIRKSLHRL